jgi:hypothetical protein
VPPNKLVLGLPWWDEWVGGDVVRTSLPCLSPPLMNAGPSACANTFVQADMHYSAGVFVAKQAMLVGYLGRSVFTPYLPCSVCLYFAHPPLTCRYGYDYDCLAPQKSSAPAAQQGSDVGHGDICELRPIPFVGAPCSDAAGVQHPFSEIMASEWQAACAALYLL